MGEKRATVGVLEILIKKAPFYLLMTSIHEAQLAFLEEALQFRRDRIQLGDEAHDTQNRQELVERVLDMGKEYGSLLNGTVEGQYLDALKKEYGV